MAVRVEGIPWVEHKTNADLQNTLVEELAKVGVEIEKKGHCPLASIFAPQGV